MAILDEVKAETPPRSTSNDGDSDFALQNLKLDLCLCKAELEKREDRIEALEEENDALKMHRCSKQTSGVVDNNMGDGSLAEAVSILFSSDVHGSRFLCFPLRRHDLVFLSSLWLSSQNSSSGIAYSGHLPVSTRPATLFIRR